MAPTLIDSSCTVLNNSDFQNIKEAIIEIEMSSNVLMKNLFCEYVTEIWAKNVDQTFFTSLVKVITDKKLIYNKPSKKGNSYLISTLKISVSDDKNNTHSNNKCQKIKNLHQKKNDLVNITVKTKMQTSRHIIYLRTVQLQQS